MTCYFHKAMYVGEGGGACPPDVPAGPRVPFDDGRQVRGQVNGDSPSDPSSWAPVSRPITVSGGHYPTSEHITSYTISIHTQGRGDLPQVFWGGGGTHL